MSSDREAALAALLESTGWAAAERQPLAGDASTRRYERLILPNKSAILMDAPPKEDAPCPPRATPAERRTLGWNAMSRLGASRVEAFAAVAGHLQSLGLSPPDIYGLDAPSGYAVLEDLGENLYAQLIPDRADETELYIAAAEVLAHVHAVGSPAKLEGFGVSWPLLDYDALALEVNADLFVEWLPKAAPDVRIDDAARARWERVRDSLIVKALGFPRAFTIRDYHAENLLWLPERNGLARVGLLDFQDAVRGWRAWDFAMLLQDARRDVSPDAAHAAIRAYLDITGDNEQAFMRELAVLGAINAMRILGIFARLDVRDGKTRYRAFMSRMWAHLATNLEHPALADARAFVMEVAGAYLEPASTPVLSSSSKAVVKPKTAMVLAAGKGTRMAPLTNTIPKPLVKVAGRSLIDHMLDRLVEAGAERAVVNVHHFADQMESHLAVRKDIKIVISDERGELLETGGGARKARPLLGDDPIFYVNTDSVWIGEGALAKLAREFDPATMDALLLLVPLDRCLGFGDQGDFKRASDGRITHRFDDPSADLAWMGAQIINPKILDAEPIEPFSFRRIWARSQAAGRLYGTVFEGFWLHVGDPGARDAAEARLAEEAAPAKARA
jgi:aminoglycoside/choline kinase family phosphotransferase/GTP:adenosylcobinamide-phosphate guanylyltransferase